MVSAVLQSLPFTISISHIFEECLTINIEFCLCSSFISFSLKTSQPNEVEDLLKSMKKNNGCVV